MCLYVCVCLWEKEKVCHVYRLTGLTFHYLHTEEKVQHVNTVCPHTVYLCRFWTYLTISAAHTIWRELFQTGILGQVNVSRSIILYMNSPKQREKEREPTGIRSVYGWMGGVLWHTSFNCHFFCPSWIIHSVSRCVRPVTAMFSLSHTPYLLSPTQENAMFFKLLLLLLIILF